MTTENIENHMAYTCKCGGVNFALLKSGGIECNKCSSQLDGVKWWAGGMGAQLARAIKAEDQRDALQAKLAAMGNTEPVAWMDEYGNPFTLSAHKGKWYGHGERNWKPLDTAPKVAQPLTDEQVRKWWASENGLEDCCMCKLDDFSQVVRAVESKHGIGGQQP